MPAAPIKAAFVADADAIAGVTAVDHEPADLPDADAVVCLLFLPPSQEDVATGLTEVTWRWRVNLYLSLRDYEKAQDELERIVPELYAIARDNPMLDGTCEKCFVLDIGREPTFAHRAGWLLQSLELRAIAEEQP